jgi:hypothetical protein
MKMKWLKYLAPFAFMASAGSATAAHPTAVYTLDAYHHTIYYDDEHPISPQLRKLAESARIVPGGAIFKLSVPEQPPPRQHNRAGVTPADDAKPLPVTVALFRDLDETVYLAACPVAPKDGERPIEQRRAPRDGTAGPAQKPGEPSKADIEDCRDVEPGHTFSVEFHDQVMQVVVRGRQVPFTVYGVQSKNRRIDTPYELTPSKLPAPSGPAPSTPPAEGMAPQSQPRWEPPEVARLSTSRPSEPVRSDVPPAQTSLRTGRVGVTCDSTRAQVYVDGAYLGACPIETPLIAGRHSVMVRQPGSENWTREIRIEAGATVRLRAGER